MSFASSLPLLGDASESLDAPSEGSLLSPLLDEEVEVEDEDEVVIDDDESDVDSESDTEEGKWQGRWFVW